MSFSEISGRLLNIVFSIGFWDIVDIVVITVVVHAILTLMKKTKAFQLLGGLLLFFFIYIIATTFKLKALTFLIDNMLQVGLIALLVVFQPELRRALEQLSGNISGNLNLFNSTLFQKKTPEAPVIEQKRKAIAAICDGVERMSEKQTGALIVMEKYIRMEGIKRSGTPINADITPELIGTIFYDGSPLHDGAMIIHDCHITYAGCVLPLSDNLEISKDMGTRHRAALGISEASDAIAIVVSEETGTISYAKNGVLRRHQDRQSLYEMLYNEFIKGIYEAQDWGHKGFFLRRRKDEEQ